MAPINATANPLVGATGQTRAWLLPDTVWKTSYRHDDGDLIELFYVPALRCAVAYDRMTGYFSADALALAELMDGKLLLVTNTPDLSPQGVVDRYKSLADIERGFRVLKSEIEIGPVFHRLPSRIKAHAAICFIALILYRVMRQRLRSADAQLSPERALAELQKLQHHQIRINQAERPVTGISRLSETQDRVFAALRSLRRRPLIVTPKN